MGILIGSLIAGTIGAVLVNREQRRGLGHRGHAEVTASVRNVAGGSAWRGAAGHDRGVHLDLAGGVNASIFRTVRPAYTCDFAPAISQRPSSGLSSSAATHAGESKRGNESQSIDPPPTSAAVSEVAEERSSSTESTSVSLYLLSRLACFRRPAADAWAVLRTAWAPARCCLLCVGADFFPALCLDITRPPVR